jgi:putative hydrolase of the HAD superfamily
MILKAKNSYFIFDLDDTLYSEIDYLKSAYKFIALKIDPLIWQDIYNEMLNLYFAGENVFLHLLDKYQEILVSLDSVINDYREHFPDIVLKIGVRDLLVKIKNNSGKIGIITNGRSRTQRNKIQALGLVELIDKVVISEEVGFEKPDPNIYKFILNENTQQYYYFGDNPKIDFITPKKLGWCCIGVFCTNNIHPYSPSECSSEYMPHMFIESFNEVEII